MTNSFLSKVSAERRVLSVVNAKTSGKLQLTGLSSAAIDLWRRKVGSEKTLDVVASLLALAELCQLLSDRSHETFKPIDTSLSAKLETHIAALQAAVARML
ncbi:MAG: hypothetical protein WCA10_16795 [Terracidiphilus sp.]